LPEMLLLSGNAHPELARAVADELNIGLVDAEIDQFPDQESRVKIIDNVREHDVFVLQPTGPPANHNLMETFGITAVTPYFGYGRQDRKEDSRVPITAKMVVNFYETAGANRFLAIDLHAHQIQGFTDLPFDHIYAARTIAPVLKDVLDNPVVASPDVGANKLARGFAEKIGSGWAIVDKDRIDSENTEVAAIVGESVKGRDVVIVDDMITTGGSMLTAAQALKEQGGAKKVIAAVTHGVLCGDAVERIIASEYLDLLFTTDTLPAVSDHEKIRRITIAPFLAKAISNVHNGTSLKGLF
jgi:ribose-phosphate pyrophosphokinase